MGIFYALVHYPHVETRSIDLLRQKYDPQVNLIEPHITLMFPVPDSVSEDILIHHLHSVLGGRQPFTIHLQGLQKSWDYHLFLMVQDGQADIIDLYREIYTGVLTNYRKEGIPFVPHLTLGVFAHNVNEYDEALEQAKQMDLNYRSLVDKVHLVKIDDERRQILSRREFSLGFESSHPDQNN